MTPDEAEKLWKEKKVNVVSGSAKSRSNSLDITENCVLMFSDVL
jgi:hypothetical protein